MLNFHQCYFFRVLAMSAVRRGHGLGQALNMIFVTDFGRGKHCEQGREVIMG